jgi:hypothetical protein
LPASAPVLLVLHIPKTGGSTLEQILYTEYEARYPSRPTDKWMHYGVFCFAGGFYGQSSPQPPATYRRYLQRDDLHAVFGHFYFGLHREIPEPSAYITLLRDPIDRVLSLYSHLLTWPELHTETLVPQTLTLEEFVTGPMMLGASNDQIRRITGCCDISAMKPAELLDAAKENIDRYFSFVGVTEMFDESLLLMKDQFGWESVFYHSELVSERRLRRANVPQSLLDLIAERNALDISLYAYARSRLAGIVASQGPNFIERVSDFRVDNDHWNRHGSPQSQRQLVN